MLHNNCPAHSQPHAHPVHKAQGRVDLGDDQAGSLRLGEDATGARHASNRQVGLVVGVGHQDRGANGTA